MTTTNESQTNFELPEISVSLKDDRAGIERTISAKAQTEEQVIALFKEALSKLPELAVVVEQKAKSKRDDIA